MVSQESRNNNQQTTNENQYSTNERQAVKNAVSDHKIHDLEREIRDLRERDIRSLREQQERDTAELRRQLEVLTEERNHYLKWGIITLGSMVVGLVTWIVTNLGSH